MSFRKYLPVLMSLAAVVAGVSAAQALPTLGIGSASGTAGATVSIPVTFNPSTSAVAGIEFALTLPASLSTGTVTPGAILTAAGKSVSTNLSGATWTFIVFGLNQTTLSSGTLLTAQLQIAPGTLPATLNLPVSGVVYSDAAGNLVPAGASTGGTVTVAPPTPVITSSATATGTVGIAFSYQIAATNSPTSFNATGLPTGLSVNTVTGLISGTPVTAGTSTVTLSAISAGGTGTAPLALTIRPQAPVLSNPATASGKQWVNFLLQITASSNPTSFNATGLPAGLAVNTATGQISGTPTVASTSTVTLSATNAGGTGTELVTLSILPACDINSDGVSNVVDIQLEVNMALGITSCTSDINRDGACNVLDIQRIVNAALGGACVSP